MTAIEKICKRSKLPINKNLIQYSGTKDRRAITTQFCTTKMDLRKLYGMNKFENSGNPNASQIIVSDFKTVSEQTQLGNHSGNLFSLVIREIDPNNLTAERVESFKTHGFLNYFGRQRFGLFSPNPLIGLAILKEDYQSAIDMCLYPYDCKLEDWNRELRQIYVNDGLENAISFLRNQPKGAKFSLEAKLLFGMHKNKQSGQTSNYARVLSSLPKNLRTLFIHAFQSWLFNKMLNERLKFSKTELWTGDLVQGKGDQIPKIYDKNSCGDYTISDLVLPLIGFASEIPPNLKGFLESIFQKLGIDKENFNHRNKEFRSTGDYRKAFVRFYDDANFKSEFVTYGDDNDDLQSEIGEWNKVEITPSTDSLPKTALRIRFSLPSSAYATMASRELLHNDDVTKSN